jgi:hypothetical protein
MNLVNLLPMSLLPCVQNLDNSMISHWIILKIKKALLIKHPEYTLWVQGCFYGTILREFISLFKSLWTPFKADAIIIRLQRWENRKFREIMQLAQDYTTDKRSSQDVSTGSLSQESLCKPLRSICLSAELLLFFSFIVVLGGSILWHLQKFYILMFYIGILFLLIQVFHCLAYLIFKKFYKLKFSHPMDKDIEI